MRPRVWKPWKRILISRNTMGIIVTGKKPESNLHPLKKIAREPGGPSGQKRFPPTDGRGGGQYVAGWA